MSLVLDAVAADAGISKGGLLYHFASKNALVAGLCERLLEFAEDVLELARLDAVGGRLSVPVQAFEIPGFIPSLLFNRPAGQPLLHNLGTEGPFFHGRRNATRGAVAGR